MSNPLDMADEDNIDDVSGGDFRSSLKQTAKQVVREGKESAKRVGQATAEAATAAAAIEARRGIEASERAVSGVLPPPVQGSGDITETFGGFDDSPPSVREAPSPHDPTEESADEEPSVEGSYDGGKRGVRDNAHNAYLGAVERLYENMAVSGGGGCGCGEPRIGGLDSASDLSEYPESIYSLTKDHLINDIADAMRGLNFKIEGKSRDELVNSMMKVVPNTRANPKTFKADVRVHANVCRKVAEILNRKFGAKLIDPAGSPEATCQAAAELIYSLHTGMHSEFLAIQGDLNRIMRNLKILRGALVQNMSQLEAKLKSLKDNKAILKTNKHIALHKDVITELDRQLALLNNLLSTAVNPADVELERLVRKGKEIDVLGLIQPLDPKYPHKAGSKAFSRTMARVLQGLSLTPAYAAVIDDALKKAGITVREYAEMERMDELMARISKELAKERSEESLHELLQAMELLIKNFSRNKDIAKVLSARGGNSMSYHDGADEDVDDSWEGANESVEGGLGRTIHKEVKDRKTVRDVLFYGFNKQINASFERILAAVVVLAKKLGTVDVPMTDQLAGFRDAFAQLDDIRRRRVYFALTGYYNDAVSKEMRERFLGKLRMVSSYAESLSEMSVYSKVSAHFKDIKVAVDSLIVTIDEYADKISAKFGSAEAAAEDDAKEHKTRVGNYEAAVSGGAKLATTFRRGMDAHKSTATIQKAVKMFDYYFRVAQIRRNLREASEDMEKHSENYQELLAASIGSIIQECVDNYQKAVKELDDKNKFPYLNYSGDGSEAVHGPEHTFAKRSELKKDISKFIKAQHDARVKFWETVEAVDHYLKEFTNGVMKHPDDVKDIKSQLDDVQVISNWYDDRSGNDLALLFEMFPSKLDGKALGANDRTSPYEGDLAKATDKHYYDVIADVYVAATAAPVGGGSVDLLPGNPFLVQNPNKADKIRKQLQRVVANMALLKNLMSVFVTIGDRLGGEDIHKKTFMTPTQIYNNLCNYLVASALGYGAFNQQVLDLQTFDLGALPRAPQSTHAPVVGHALYDVVGVAGAGAPQHNIVILSVSVPSPVSADTAFRGVTTGPLAAAAAAAGAPVNVQDADLVGPLKGELASLVDLNNQINREDAHLNVLHHWGVYMRGVGSVLENIRGNDALGGNFDAEDKMFVDMMKALSAKVLTVLGTYDVMERPYEKQLINPVRMILGGAHDTPEVVENAVELYVRLPLLAEFYRELFDFNDESDKKYTTDERDKKKITMLPEMQGKFAQVVRLLFRRFSHVKNQQYTDHELVELVREINSLYDNYRGQVDATHQIIRDFMNEVNRRYGFLKYKDHVSYLRRIQSQDIYGRASADLARHREYDVDAADDYAILPGEEDIETERIAPSSAYVSKQPREIHVASVKSSLKEQHKLMYAFRCRLDKMFMEGLKDEEVCPSEKGDEDYNDPENARTNSFRFAVKRAQLRLSQLKDKKERFDIVARLIRGYNVISSADHIKYLMFHETVVSGLNVLSGIHSILERFQREVLLKDVFEVEKLLRALLSNEEAKIQEFLPNAVHVDATANLSGGMIQIGVSDYLMEKYKHRFGELNDIYMNAAKALVNGTRNRVINQRSGGDSRVVGQVTGANDGQWGGVPAGAPANSLMSVIANGAPSKTAIDTVIRYIVKRESLMKRLLEVVFSISDDLQGLVSIDVGDSIQVNFGGVRELVEGLLSDVKHYIEKMRPFIPAEILYEYERKENPGSVYWLEEHLMEKIFIGREPISEKQIAGKTKLKQKKGYVSLNDTVRILNNNYQRLVCEWDNAVKLTANPAPHDSYDVPVSALAYYSRVTNLDAPAAIFQAVAGRANDRTVVGAYNATVLDYALRHVGNERHLQNLGNALMHDLHNPNGVIRMRSGQYNSVLFAFNRILENYLSTFIDRVTNKIYRGVLDNLANGVLNGSVNNDTESWPDDLAVVAAGARDDPKPTAVLLRSLSRVMRNLMGEKDKSEKKLRYVEESLSDVSLYMKEKYRAFMPLFKTLLRELIKKAELLRKLILQDDGKKLNMMRHAAPVFALTPAGLKQINQGDKTNNHVASVLAAVNEASVGLIGCIDQVMRELGDEPRYMETRINALADYKAQYGKEPLTPLSNLLYVMKGDPDNDLLQLQESQGPKFKLQYGTRYILARPDAPLRDEYMPSVSQLYDMYNAVLSPREQLESGRNKEFNNRLIVATRWLHETKNIKNQLTVANRVGVYNDGLPTAYELVNIKPDPANVGHIESVDPANPLVAPTVRAAGFNRDWRLTATLSTHADNDIKAVYALHKDPSALVDLTENSLRNQKIEVLSRHISKDAKKRDLIMQNILDMNVVPINIHAFMREMPLANIYNYSYTFERLIIELFYGINEPDVRQEMLDALCSPEKVKIELIRDPKDLFVALLIDPYLNVVSDGLYELMRKLFRGDSSMELDRPKYLGDQVFNKALFDNLYRSAYGVRDLGPPAQNPRAWVRAATAATAATPTPAPGPAPALPAPRVDVVAHLEATRSADVTMRLPRKVPRVKAPKDLNSADPPMNYGDARNPADNGSLTYLSSAHTTQSRANSRAVQTRVVDNIIQILRATGLLRFNTVLVRNLIFLVNLYRVIRLKLRKDLMYDRNIILKSHAVAREDSTEHIRNQRWHRDDYPPEILTRRGVGQHMRM